MHRNSKNLLLVAGLLGLYACSSPQVMGPSGGGMPMPPGGGIPSPGGGGIPSPGGGTPSPGGGIPSPGGGIPSPGGGIPNPGDGSAGVPGGSGGGGGSGDASDDGGGGIPNPGEGQAGGGGDDTTGGGGSGGDEDGPGGSGGDSDVFGSGDDADRQAGGRGGDDEFDRALEDFDEVIAQEREAIGSENGEAADEVVASTAGSGVMGSEGGSEMGERARMGGPTGEPPARTAVEVEGCNDADTVARQLCEAATMEQDPFLRAALWDEYNAYREILSRQ